MSLQQLIGELTTEAERRSATDGAAPDLVPLWCGGVSTLLDRIENDYLGAYVASGQIRLVRTAVCNHAPHYGAFEIDALLLRVGDRHVAFRPEYRPTPAGLGVVAIEEGAGAPAALLAFSTVGEDGWRWTAPATPGGLRRLLRPLLPAEAVPLDEQAFLRVLATVLVGPQPVFTRDGTVLRARLAALLDRAGQVRLPLARVRVLLRRGSSLVARRLPGRVPTPLPPGQPPRLGFDPPAARDGKGGSDG